MKKLMKIILILITVTVFVVGCAKGDDSIVPTAPSATNVSNVQQPEAPAPVAQTQQDTAPAVETQSAPAPIVVEQPAVEQENVFSKKKTGLERAYEVSGNETVGNLLMNGNPGKGKK